MLVPFRQPSDSPDTLQSVTRVSSLLLVVSRYNREVNGFEYRKDNIDPSVSYILICY